MSLLASERLGHDTAGVTRRAYLSRLGASATLRGRATRIRPEGVEWADAGGKTAVLPARSLVVAEPVRPAVPSTLGGDGRANALGIHTVRIGDAREPRTIGDAIAEARQTIEALPVLDA